VSVINRIEIANLLNKHGDIASPWEAKMRHLLLDLRGQSSAISMENGFGKTTMAEALIGMLSRDRQLLTRTRRKCSPSKVNGEGRSWTHLRVEFRAQGGDSQQEDMLAAAGEEVAGETFVFGMYGYSDGSGLVFYHYPGTFADVPVHHVTLDGKLALYANADFQRNLRDQSATRAHNREEWLEAVGAHISRRELAQLAAFQKEGGADKSQIFNAIKPRAGEKADQAFFYEVLAPQILSGATRGETDEEEELIEDVILNSGTRITELRHRLAEAESDQRRAEEKVERLASLDEEGEALLEARSQLVLQDAALLEAERLLGGQALAPLPGLPGAGSEGRDTADDEAGGKGEKDIQDAVVGFAWAVGDTERPRVSTWLLAKLTRQAERNVRLALSERGSRVDTHRRLIHLPTAAWIGSRDIGHVAFDQARAWLADSHAFNDDAARYRALGLLDDAAEAFEGLDGNRFREEVIADREYRRSLRLDAEQLDEEVERLEHEREQLESRQRDFIDNQSVYTQALAEGLFTETELESPESTRDAAQSTLTEARRAHAEHLGRMGELKQPAQWHEAFVVEHPDTTPGELLALKQEQQETLESELAECDSEWITLDGQRESLRGNLQAHREQRQRLEGELAPLQAGREAWQAFAERWPEASAIGFWSERKNALAALEQTLAETRRESGDAASQLDRLVPLADSAGRYRHWHGEASPVHLRDTLYRQSRECQDRLHRIEQESAQFSELDQARQRFQTLCPDLFQEHGDKAPAVWLKDAKARYPRLLREAETLADTVEARERYLDSLSGDPLARQAAEAQAHQLLEAREIAFRPLHEVLSGGDADDDARRDWLSQAAGQLFAPVVEGIEAAREASTCLIDAGCGVPVLEAGRLVAILERGESPLGAVQGVETLAVKAALDPAFLTALREETQQRLEIDRQRQQALADEIARLDPHGERFRLALKACEALEQQAEMRLAALEEQRATAENEQEALTPRLSEAALKSIDDYQRFLEEGGERALADAREAREAAEARLETLLPQREQAARELETHGSNWLAAERFAEAGGVERLGEIDASLQALTEELAELDERFAELTLRSEELDARRGEFRERLQGLFADGERECLRRLEAFVAEDGPAFMQQAEVREAELEAALAQASRRADFDFARIRAFLQVRDEKGGSRTLERDIGRLKQTLGETRDKRKRNTREQGEIETRLGRHQQALNVTDQLAMAWLEVLRQLPEGWPERALADATAGWPSDHADAEPLDEAMSEWRRWQSAPLDPQEDQAFDLEALETCQQTLLDGLGSLNLGERARNRERQARDVVAREKALEMSLEAASASRLFNESERARLGTLEGVTPEALESLRGLHRQLQGQLDEHRGRVTRLHTSREQIEDTLVERLSSIIIDAAGNLEILRRVARRSADGGAYFEVKADLIADESVRELIQQLLADIDAHLAVQRRRLEQAGDGAQAKGGRDDDLTRQIRRRIYRGLFRDVSIRIKHDAIRPHGRLFSLNEDMSEGQREAVSLMWLVKLSEFAIERELRELPGNHKRRARASRESVILLDGLFSKLSHRRLIQDSLESLRNTRGRFQMIGLIHNPNYENDPSIFPTYLVGSVIGGQQGQGGHVIVREGRAVSPEESGRGAGEASLFGIHVTPAPVE